MVCTDIHMFISTCVDTYIVFSAREFLKWSAGQMHKEGSSELL